MMAGVTAPAIREVQQLLARRRGLVLCGLAGLMVLLFTAAMLIGDYPLSPAEVFAALLSPVAGSVDASAGFIVLGVRLPRAVAAVVTGAAFGLSGAVFQTVLRNPLASPDIIGITTGASAAAVVAILLFKWTGVPVALSACLGAVCVAGVIYALAWRGGITPYRLVLVGIGTAAMGGALISYLFTRARVNDVQRALAWLAGSLNGATFEALLPLGIGFVLLLPALVALSRPLRSLELGDDTARALGARVELSRMGLLLVAVLFAALATSTVGPISFVAFLAGPIARRLLGPAPALLPAAAMTGALLTLGADLIAQHGLGRNQLPVGVVTGALGAVFLIYLLIAANRAGRGN
jgi:iron complex transport system permease protein